MKAKDLRGKKKDDLLKQLEEQKQVFKNIFALLLTSPLHFMSTSCACVNSVIVIIRYQVVYPFAVGKQA